MYFSSTKRETSGKLMVYIIFLSGWRESYSDWGNCPPGKHGRIKKGTWISQPSKALQEFLNSIKVSDITIYTKIQNQTQSHPHTKKNEI